MINESEKSILTQSQMDEIASQREETERQQKEKEKAEAERVNQARIAADRERQENEAKEQARMEAENSFREELEKDFLKANAFAESVDFERLYQALRDAIMLENLKDYRKNVNK